jgi:phosphoethanolamine N-methyltransferase
MTCDFVSQGYDRDFIELVELVYGKGFLSQGGEESIKKMDDGLELNGLKILDIGSGLGGPSLWLAKHYRTEIIGLEPQGWMVEIARNYLKEAGKLKSSLDFVEMPTPTNLRLFDDASFDVIVSKECLLHIPHELKPDFYLEIHRVLKPNGRIIIMDWMHASTHYSENTIKMMELDGFAYNLITADEYVQILEKAGFYEIELKDTTSENVRLSQQNMDTIASLRKKFAKDMERRFTTTPWIAGGGKGMLFNPGNS